VPFFCLAGYVSSKSFAVCQPNGIWDIPTCLPQIVCPESTLTTAVHCVEQTLPLTVYSAAMPAEVPFQCLVDFVSSSEVATCSAEGLWLIPACLPKIVCPTYSLVTALHCVLDFLPETIYSSVEPATVVFSCLEGFTSGSSVATCNSAGLWDIPVCVLTAILCPLTPLLPSACDCVTGSLPETVASQLEPVTVPFFCLAGYVSSKSFAVCQPNGIWDIPTCLPQIVCPTYGLNTALHCVIDFLPATSYSASKPATVVFQCLAGFDSNTDVATCLSTGLWDIPTCVPSLIKTIDKNALPVTNLLKIGRRALHSV